MTVAQAEVIRSESQQKILYDPTRPPDSSDTPKPRARSTGCRPRVLSPNPNIVTDAKLVEGFGRSPSLSPPAYEHTMADVIPFDPRKGARHYGLKARAKRAVAPVPLGSASEVRRLHAMGRTVTEIGALLRIPYRYVVQVIDDK